MKDLRGTKARLRRHIAITTLWSGFVLVAEKGHYGTKELI
jgi:hypothetical protein